MVLNNLLYKSFLINQATRYRMVGTPGERYLCEWIKGHRKGQEEILTPEQIIHPFYKSRIKVIKKIKQTPEVIKK